jgi:hypothetical protein
MHYLAISNNSKKIISLPHKPLQQFPKFFSPIFAQNAQVCARVEGHVVDLICLKAVLAVSFAGYCVNGRDSNTRSITIQLCFELGLSLVAEKTSALKRKEI